MRIASPLLPGLLYSISAVAQIPMTLSFQSMAVDPSNSQSLWGATATTLYHSTDGGNLFRPVPIAPSAGTPVISWLAIHPQSGATLFVIAQYTPSVGLLWKSVNGGQTWTSVDPPGAPTTIASQGAATFFFNRAAPQTIYYQINNQLFKSVDGGTTWKVQQASLPGNRIEVNAADATRMYCLLAASALNGSGLAVSNDEGLTWTAAAAPPAGTSTAVVKAIQGAEVHSNPRNRDSLIYVAGITFQDQLQGEQTSGGFVFYSADGGQSFRAPTGVPTNTFANYYLSGGGEIMLNQGLSTEHTVNRSLDFGATWSANPQFVAQPYAFDPRNAQSVYGAGYQQRSSDGGVTWQPQNPKTYPEPRSLAVSLTLETGTAYVSLGGTLTDTEGNNLIVSNPVATASDSWLSASVQTYPGSETYYTYRISAAGLTPGNHKGQIRVSSPDLVNDWLILVDLTVVNFVPPQLRFSSQIVAGTGTSAFSGDDGPAAKASIECCASGLAFDSQGNLYLDSQHRVRRISAGTISTFAGTGNPGDAGDGGPAKSATFGSLYEMAYTSNGLVVEDALNNRLRIIGPDGRINALYSGPFSVTPTVSFITALVSDSHGTLFLTDGSGIFQWKGSSFLSLYSVPQTQASLRYLGFTAQNDLLATTAGQLFRFTGSALSPLAGTGIAGFAGDHASVQKAQIQPTTGPVSDSKGNIYFADIARVRVIMPSGAIETVAGDGDTVNPLPNGDAATNGSLGIITALAIDAHDNLFVATQNNFIYELSPETAPPAPQINAGGVVSLPSGMLRLCPGEMFSIYGTNLSSSKGGSPSIPLLQDVNGVIVDVNGKPAPIFYVNGPQVNAQLPWETPEGNAMVQVSSGGVSSNTIKIQVVAAAPDILQYNGHHAVALMPNGSLNGPTNPASSGTYLVIYLTGIGAVDQAVASGEASPASPPAKVTSSYKATLDGKSIPVAFLGLAPGFVGLGQLNLQVPAGLSAGDHSLILTIAGNASNTVQISVK